MSESRRKRHTLEVLERTGDVLQRGHGVEADLHAPLEPVLLEHLLLDEARHRSGVALHAQQERLRLLAREAEDGGDVAEVVRAEGRDDEGQEEEVEVRLRVEVEDGQREVGVVELDTQSETARSTYI